MRDGEREIYLEFAVAGAFARVTAIDSRTGTEVSITGPVTARQADLETLAVRRLHAKLREGEQAAERPKAPPAPRPGRLV
jgi:hypothetical protein